MDNTAEIDRELAELMSKIQPLEARIAFLKRQKSLILEDEKEVEATRLARDEIARRQREHDRNIAMFVECALGLGWKDLAKKYSSERRNQKNGVSPDTAKQWAYRGARRIVQKYPSHPYYHAAKDLLRTGQLDAARRAVEALAKERLA